MDISTSPVLGAATLPCAGGCCAINVNSRRGRPGNRVNRFTIDQSVSNARHPRSSGEHRRALGGRCPVSTVTATGSAQRGRQRRPANIPALPGRDGHPISSLKIEPAIRRKKCCCQCYFRSGAVGADDRPLVTRPLTARQSGQRAGIEETEGEPLRLIRCCVIRSCWREDNGGYFEPSAFR